MVRLGCFGSRSGYQKIPQSEDSSIGADKKIDGDSKSESLKSKIGKVMKDILMNPLTSFVVGGVLLFASLSVSVVCLPAGAAMGGLGSALMLSSLRRPSAAKVPS